MTQTMQPAPGIDRLLNNDASASEPQWLTQRRADARAVFSQHGVPTTKDEAWRFTNVAPVATTDFQVPEKAGSVDAADVRDVLVPDTKTIRIVFIDGVIAPEFCDGSDDMVTSITDSANDIENELGKAAKLDAIDAFGALNTALFRDGVVVRVPDNATLERPVEIIYITSGNDAPAVIAPRTLIIAGKNATACVVETFIGATSTESLSVPVTEIIADTGANVDHYKIVRESDRTHHVGTVALHQEGESDVGSKVVTFSGKVVRNNMSTVLDGENANCDLRGLSVVGKDALVDNHLRINHDKPHCDSREFFKNILDANGKAVFTGRIYVAEDAQKTDAKQTNMSLLLSDDAQINANPQLEIYADDVKCTHGATIGELDPDAMFYLKSRGLSEDLARSTLIYGFAAESLEEIKIEPLRRLLRTELVQRLPGGDLLLDDAI